MIGEMMRNPQTDDTLRDMVQEMHTMMTRSSARVLEPTPPPAEAEGSRSRPRDANTVSRLARFPYEVHDAAVFQDKPTLAYPVNDSPSQDGPYATGLMSAKSPIELAFLQHPFDVSHPEASNHINRPKAVTTHKPHTCTSQNIPDTPHNISDALLRNIGNVLSSKTISLNNTRHAIGGQEYEAFVKRHHQPTQHTNATKFNFLATPTPSIQELQACIPYIFHSVPESTRQTQERKEEIKRWAQDFSHIVESTTRKQDENMLTFLTILNEAVENSSNRALKLFYSSTDSMGFAEALDRLQSVSKSVRVMKEIEEFQDARKEWES
jgi:hypothetical protein